MRGSPSPRLFTSARGDAPSSCRPSICQRWVYSRLLLCVLSAEGLHNKGTSWLQSVTGGAWEFTWGVAASRGWLNLGSCLHVCLIRDLLLCVNRSAMQASTCLKLSSFGLL